MQVSARRRIAVGVVALSILAVIPGAFTSAASAASANQDISLTTSSFPSMRPGETAWVSTFWSGANFDAHNFKLTASSSGATVSYPTNTGTFSSFYGASDLLSKSTDYAALKLTVSDNATGAVTINLHVTYDLDQNNGAHPNPVSKTKDLQVSLPVTTYTGLAITPVTSSLGPVAHGSSAWVQYSVRGEKPGVTSLTAQLSGPPGITVAYPNDATSSSPNQSSTLSVLSTDYFAFHVSVGNIAAGTYNVTITMSYGSAQQQVATVPLVVT